MEDGREGGGVQVAGVEEEPAGLGEVLAEGAEGGRELGKGDGGGWYRLVRL